MFVIDGFDISFNLLINKIFYPQLFDSNIFRFGTFKLPNQEK